MSGPTSERRWRRDGKPIGDHVPPEMVRNDGEVTAAWWHAHHQEINQDTWTYRELRLMYGDPELWTVFRHPVGVINMNGAVR